MINTRSPRSLSRTLAIAFAGLSILVLVVSGLIGLIVTLQTQQTLLADQEQNIATDASAKVDSYIKHQLDTLETAALLVQPSTASTEQTRQAMSSLLRLEPDLRQVVFLTQADQIEAMVSRLPEMTTTDVTLQLTPDALAKIKSGTEFISPIYIDTETKLPMVVMAVPATNAAGDFQGILAAEVGLKSMWDLINQLQVGKTGTAYLVDRQGKLLAFSDTARVLSGENVAHQHEVQNFLAGETVLPLLDLSPGIDGTLSVGGWSIVKTADWAVIIELPWYEAYGPAIQGAIWSFLTTLALASLAALAGIQLARRLAVPLLNLTDTATRITRGQWSLQAPVTGTTEVARLATAFNSMTKQLTLTLEGLEQRVADRTSELAKNNTELEANRNQLQAGNVELAKNNTALETNRNQLQAGNVELEANQKQLENANRDLQQNAAYLDALYETTIRLMGKLELTELLHAITRRATTLIGTENGYIYVHEPGLDEMEMSVGIGIFHQMVGTKAQRGVGVTGTVWETAELLVIDDYRTWEKRLNRQGIMSARTVIGIPLKSRDQVIGVFGLAYTDDNKKFDAALINVLSRFASLASIALQNARLYDAAQKEIGERKQAEEKFRILFAASPDAILLIDPNQPGWPIVDCNQVSCEMNGYTREELIGSSIDILNIQEGTPQQREGYLGEVKRAGVMRVEGEHRHKDGYRFPIETSTSIIQLGERELILGIDRDVTKRKEVERMKTEFISTVSHELRTPLTSIRGSLGLIAGGVAGQIPERAKMMVDIAYKNSERLVRLINDILDIEKIESGKMVFQLTRIDLIPLIEQTMDANRAYGEEYHVKYILTQPPQALFVDVDADRITQVLTNLLSNAAKFSPPQSNVEVSVERVGTRVRVGVQDHGTGIPEEFKGRIFQKFAQADSSDTRQKGGTGLGLSIVKAIVEKHDGTIGFDSVPGQGTTFYFELPEYHDPLLTVPAPVPLAPRILIFEDDHDVALLLRMMLRQGGIESDVAHSRAEALELAQSKHYGALTLDSLLSDDEGVAFIHELRASPATRDLPIIVVSAQAEQTELQLNGDAVWVADFLQKPIDQRQLLRAVRSAMRGVHGGKPQILHVEDDEDVLQVVRAILDKTADVTCAHRVDEARALLEQTTFDLVILDAVLPDGSGIELLPLLGRNGTQTPVVIFSANENDAGILARVNASLVKSRTSNEQLLHTIKHLIPRGKAQPIGVES